MRARTLLGLPARAASRRRGWWAAAGLLLALAGPAAAHAGEWATITTEQGVTVSEREVEGRSLPTFRGVAVFDASIYEILAVLADVQRQTEWMHNCSDARLIERKPDGTRVLYNRTDVPWPVADRDVVLRSHIEVLEPGRVVVSRFQNMAGQHLVPVPADAVRMPKLRGHYRFTALEGGRTRVEYQVDADPGGTLPTWLAKRATRELPLHTLVNLRARVAATRSQYAAEAAAFRAALEPAAAAAPPP